MTTKTKTTETTATTAATFSKEQVLFAKKYVERRDLLAALLVDDKFYTLAEVDQLIEDFLKKEVK